MSRYAYARLSQGQVLTWYCYRFTTAFQGQISALLESEEVRVARFVFLHDSNEGCWTESTSSCFRLEKAIENWKPGRIKTNPATNFWTVYKRVADEHDNDLVSKYVGDLDTSLLFVSAFTSLARLISLKGSFSVSGGFILGSFRHFHCPNHSQPPAKPHRSDKRPVAPNITTRREFWWSRPTDTHLEYPN